jgi:cation diffusion facilitator family transporter
VQVTVARRTHDVDAGRRATIAAFLANVGISVAKLLAWFFTGSASMLAETVHSLADSANQGLLLFGRRRSREPANDRHPFGYGRERYFWAFVVAMVLFSGGALFALVEGEEKLRKPHELSSPQWAIGVLLVALVLETLSLRTAVKESAGRRWQGESWLAFVRRTSIPELAVILLEDTGALIGVGLALLGTISAAVLHMPRLDAIGSIGIGILLAGIAFTLATEMKSLLIGEAAQPHQVAAIRESLNQHPSITHVRDLRTEHLGPDDLLVVATVHVDATTAEELNTIVTQAERAIRQAIPIASHVYLRTRPPASDPPSDPPRSVRQAR